MTEDQADESPELPDEVPEEQDTEPEGEDGAENQNTRIPIDPATLESLLPFRDLQRSIAAIDFGAVGAAQEAVAGIAASLPDLTAIQDSMRAHLANSIDFSAISELRQSVALPSGLEIALQQKDLAAGLARSLNLDALERARDMFATTNMSAFAEAQRAMAEAVSGHHQDLLKTLGTIDVGRLAEELDRWLPLNLRDGDNLEEAARIALEEGLPVSWVPRTSIVQAMIDAASPEERLDVLDRHREDILDDCLEAVSDVPHHWARECEEAVQAMRANVEGPAQSHAANIIDSIVLWTLGPKGRDVAKDRATEDFEDLGLRVAGEALVLRPLNRALTTWWPTNGTPPPDHFARHATAHAVGYAGLFDQRYALVAIMLAVSLTVQFWDDPASAGGLLPPSSDDGLDSTPS